MVNSRNITVAEDSDSDDNRESEEGWVAVDDLPLYNSDGNSTHFLEKELENGHLENLDGTTSPSPPPPPPTEVPSWRADFDDLKPSIDNATIPFDLTPDQLDAVKARMQSISLNYKPDWAAVVEESTWREHLQSRLARPGQEEKS